MKIIDLVVCMKHGGSSQSNW